jgi:UDP-N-acetylglucosamine acyltransferase
VDRHAELESDVRIGPYAIVGPNVRIGSGTTVGAHAILDGWTEVGERVRIFPHAVVGTEPQDLKFAGGQTWLRIGDRTVIREFATLNPATGAGESTVVGSDCLLMAYSHVAHNCSLGNHVILANSVNLAGHVTVGDYAILGGVTPVHQFVRIGEHSMVGGGSRIPQDVAPFTLVSGNPPETYGLNLVGLTRRGFPRESIDLLKAAYRILFRSKLTVDEAADRIRSEVPSAPEVVRLLEFFRSSERGVTR